MAINQDLVMKFTNTPLSSLVLDIEDTDLIVCSTKKCLELDSNEVVNGVLLNGRKFEHTKWVSSEIQIIISADDLAGNGFILDNAKMEYLKAWWSAKHKYIAFVPPNATLSYTGELNRFLASDLHIDYDETATITFFEVITGGGLFPLSFINDLNILPELTLNLKRLLPK